MFGAGNHPIIVLIPMFSGFLVAVFECDSGGFWMDTDVLLIRDLTPLAQEDFAYLGQDLGLVGHVTRKIRPQAWRMAVVLLLPLSLNRLLTQPKTSGVKVCCLKPWF